MTYAEPRFEDVELGVTGQVVALGSLEFIELFARYERIVFGKNSFCWVCTHHDAEGQPTGDWSAVSKDEAEALGLLTL